VARAELVEHHRRGGQEKEGIVSAFRLPFEADYVAPKNGATLLAALPFDLDEPTGPGRPLPFDLEPEPEAAPAISWTDLILHDAPHCRIIGESGSGKTTIAQVLAAKTDGQITIVDPLWESATWGGLPGAMISPTGDFALIRAAIQSITEELHHRIGKLQTGEARSFPRLTIIWDEVPLCVSEVKEAGPLIRALGNFGRHANMHMIGMSQSTTVGSWGLEGYGDAASNFASIYLGKNAVAHDPTLAGVDHPAVLEWRDNIYPLDMSGMRQAGEVDAQEQLRSHPEKIFQLPPPKPPAELSTRLERRRRKRLYRQVRKALREKLTALSTELAPAKPLPPSFNVNLPESTKVETSAPSVHNYLDLQPLAEAVTRSAEQHKLALAEQGEQHKQALELSTAQQQQTATGLHELATAVKDGLAAQAPPVVNLDGLHALAAAIVKLVETLAQQKAPVVNVPAPVVNVAAPVIHMPPREKIVHVVERDRQGNLTRVVPQRQE
jgi:hypothetical protein